MRPAYKQLMASFEDRFAPLSRTASAFIALFPPRKDSESLEA